MRKLAMLWDTRLMWIMVGLLISAVLTGVIYGGHITGVWDWLWLHSGLWQFFVTEPEVTPSQVANDTLLNSGFEDGFYVYQGINELKVPNAWTPWWREGDKAPSNIVYRRPEWSPVNVSLAAYLVHGGAYSSKMFTTYGAHNAGLYQRVKTVPGRWYEFSAWVYVWSSSGTDGRKSEAPTGRYRAMVCANPWGSTQNWDDTTICGKDILDVYDSWQRVSVIFQAWSNETTLFTKGNSWYPVRSNDSTWDDLRFVPAEIGQECPVCPPPDGLCVCNCEVDYNKINDLIINRPPVKWPR